MILTSKEARELLEIERKKTKDAAPPGAKKERFSLFVGLT